MNGSVLYKLGLCAAFCCMMLVPVAGYCRILVVGQVAPMTGKQAYTGRFYRAGIKAYFDSVNKSGGVNGNFIKLVDLDDNGNPETNFKLTKQLIANEKPVALIGYGGTASARELSKSQLLAAEGIPLVGVRSTEPRGEPNFFNVRATANEEIVKLIEQCRTTAPGSHIAMIYDPESTDPRTVTLVENIARNSRLVFDGKEVHSQRSGSNDLRLRSVLRNDPDFLLLLMDGTTAAAYADSISLLPKRPQLLLTSEVDLEVLMRRLGSEQARGIILAQVLPNPYEATIPLTREFAKAGSATSAGFEINYTSLEGYIAAKVLIEAVRRAGTTVNRETLLKSLSSLGAFDLGGYVVEYRPGNRIGSKWIELSIINKNGKLTH